MACKEVVSITTTQSPHKEQGSIKAWVIWGLAALAFGYAFFHRVSPGVMVEELMAEFAVGAAVLGTLSALYFYPYVLMQIPLGVLIDRWGARRLLTYALIVAGFGSLILAYAETITIAYFGRLLIGAGCAVGFLGSLALASAWFRPERYAMLAGLTMFFGMMSGVFAQGPLSEIVQAIGWRYSVFGMGAFGFILGFLILMVVRNRPAEKTGAKKRKSTWAEVFKGFREAGSNLQVWKIAIIASTMSGPMLTLGGLWAIPYMIVTYDLPKTEASSLVSLLLLGWAIGAPLSGWLSDRIRMRKGLLVVSSCLLTMIVLMFAFVPNQALWVSVALLIGMGVFGSFMTVCFALVRETAPSHITSSVTGIVNSFTVASGAFLQPIVGYVLDRLWDGSIVDGARVYTTENYKIAFISVAIACVIGTLLSFTIKETKVWD